MDTIHLVAPLLPSVGRINGLGSCIVLSMTPDASSASQDQTKYRAILLTTSHCLTRRVDAHGLEAIFFENPMEGSSAAAASSSSYRSSLGGGFHSSINNAGNFLGGGGGASSSSFNNNNNNKNSLNSATTQQPVAVLLRPETVFITSAEDPKARKNQHHQNSSSSSSFSTNSPKLQSALQQQQQEASIGYTIVACDIEGRNLNTGAASARQNLLYKKKLLLLQQQQQQQNEEESSKMRTHNNNNNAVLELLDSNGTNKNNSNFSNGLDAYKTSSDAKAGPLGSLSNPSSKYRPLYDTKAIEKAAQDRVAEVKRAEEAKQKEIEDRKDAARNLQQQLISYDDHNYNTNNNTNHDHNNHETNPNSSSSHNININSQTLGSISTIVPVGLPLIQSRCPTVYKGDRHLVVTHAAGTPNRKIYTLTVGEAHDNYCVYNEVDTTVMFSSGGIVFSTQGDFIGIQHQSPGPDCSHYCMFIKEITQHLYLTHSLSSIQVPILDGSVEDVEGIVGTVAKSVFDRDLFVLGEDPLWKRQRDALIRGNPADQDMLNRAAPDSGILTGEARAMYVRTRSRYGGNYSQLVDFSELEREQNLRKRYIPKTLLVCDHLEIFNAYYQPNNYSSLVHMVGSFGYHPELTKMILTKLVSHEHRNDLARFAEFQGMPPLLETMERNGESADITQAAVTALGRLTQFELNREALNRYNGLQSLLAILQGWPHHIHIIEWGCFTIMNMTEKSSTLRSKENAKTITDNEGIQLLCGFVRTLGIRASSSSPHPSGHICRWGLTSLSNLIADDKTLFDQSIQEGNDLCGIIVDAIVHFSDSPYALFGISSCFLTLVHLELFSAASDFFINAGAISRVLSILQAMCSAARSYQGASFVSDSTSAIPHNLQQVNANKNANNDNSFNSNNNNHNHNQNTKNNNRYSGSSSFGSAADAIVAQNFLTALHHIVEQRPIIKTDLVYLGTVEIAAACARVFSKEGELVNIVASLVSSLK